MTPTTIVVLTALSGLLATGGFLRCLFKAGVLQRTPRPGAPTARPQDGTEG